MKPLSVIIVVLLLTHAVSVVADSATSLPVSGSAQWPMLLLDLGNEMTIKGDNATQIAMGEVSAKDGVTSIETTRQEINALHPGFGRWSVDFRFQLDPRPQTQHYQFWARWRQGGEPDVCVQTFEIWAGTDKAHLEKRATYLLKPKGWEAAWISGDTFLDLKSDDRVIEIRNSGAGHDAKVFDAFLLAPALASLPAIGGTDKPTLLLELGKSPRFAGLGKHEGLQVQVGSARVGSGAASLLLENDEVQVFHQGFGSWSAHFAFQLEPSIRPGRYRFFARYKSGGEVSQVKQRFLIKAGAKPEQLAVRSELTLLNDTPWEYQWLQASESITFLPGDRWLEIENSGQADGAKVFDSFLLQRDASVADWMSVEQVQLRNRFLAQVKSVPESKLHLYVLDGNGKNDRLLFDGLAMAEAQRQIEQLSVSYLIGEEADAMAQRLNIPTLPAALISDDHYSLLGVLTEPKSEADAALFLNDPAKTGWMPVAPAVVGAEPKPLLAGMPESWLVGGIQDGLAGMSIYGVDSEAVLRPNPDQPYLSLQMMGGAMQHWQAAQTQADGSVDVLKSTQHGYGWSRGTGYAQLYIYVDKAMLVWLHLKQSGIRTSGWLDGRPFSFADDLQPPAGFASRGERVQTWLKGLTTEGLLATAMSEHREVPQQAKFELAPGWHSLLLKLAMQHDQAERFFFKALFTDTNGRPIDAMKTRLSDPGADLALNRIANQLRPLIFVDAPANLPHPGEPIKLRVDMRWHKVLEQTSLPAPLPRFQAKLLLRLVNYDGKEIAVREIKGLFPDQTEVAFEPLTEPGYYAVYASLYSSDGRLIMNYPADGFSVVKGSADQKQRLAKKKLWNNDYYALADGDNSFMQAGGYFSWLRRVGIFKSYGSYPGFDTRYRSQWEQVKQQGLEMFADFAGDSHWLNDSPDEGRNFMQSAAAFTRFFKASNEIDIRHEPEWQKLRDPKHWVERAKREFEQAHQARADAHYVGGSLVRPAEGDWFKQVLQLGLDRYQDAWDVHAYPQKSPRFGQPLGNGETEDERGVLSVYASLGKKNSLPFWLGETGAKAMHGWSGRRWQAEQVAKMIAWVNSRSDYLGVAFCIAHEYDQAYGRIWDYSMGHKPGEAALYTASALIDGLPYQSIDSQDAVIQAAYFGPTLMIWRDDGAVGDWPLQLDPAKDWVMVDVVGRSQALPVDKAGNAHVAISASPVYVLSRDDYQRLTRD